MYVTLTGIQNGEPVYLASVPGTACEGLEVALCELTYYHRWLNIGAALGNNQVSTGQSTLKIPDGYYNACELDDVLQPLGTELRLHAPIGRLELSAERRLVVNRQLADLLGFSQNTFEPVKTHTADKPHRLNVHREVSSSSWGLGRAAVCDCGTPWTFLLPFFACTSLRSALRKICTTVAHLRCSDPSPLRTRDVGAVGRKHFPTCSKNGDCFSTDPHGIRRRRQKVRFRPLKCCPTPKKCLTRVALGAPENAPGWL